MNTKETQEAAEAYLAYWRSQENIHLSNTIHAERSKNDFKAGAEWQKKVYHDILNDGGIDDQKDHVYMIVQWPETQEMMDLDWFDLEAVLAPHGKFGNSAYFIPIKRYRETLK